MLPRNIPSSSPAPADPLAGPAVPPDRDPLLIPAAPVLAADSEEFPEPWEPAAEPNLIRRWLKGWRLVIVLAVLALGYLKWRGGHDYAHGGPGASLQMPWSAALTACRAAPRI
jgi:hypothetical protein